MRIFKILLITLFSLLSLQVFSDTNSSLDGYFKRFDFVRKDGKLLVVRDRKLVKGFSLDSVLKYLEDSLIAEQKLMHNKSNEYWRDVDELITSDLTLKENSEYATHIRNSLVTVGNIDLENVLKSNDVQYVLREFEKKLTEKLFFLDFSVLANPNEPRFFYIRDVTYEAVQFALNLAKKRFSNVPILNVISYIIVEAERMISERRTFHQNMLLHYLENYKEEDLKLTHDEVNTIISSIYESRIGWMNILESNQAVRSWSKYGIEKFFTQIRAGNTQLRNYTHIYDQIDERIDFAFQKTTYQGKKVVINKINSQNSFSGKPSISYYYDEPSRVIRTRQLIQVVELGLNIIPIPNFIKGQVQGFLDSMFKQQKLTEGALFAYFESTNEVELMKALQLAQVNPFTVP